MAEKAPTEDVREGEKSPGKSGNLHLRELEAVSKKKGRCNQDGKWQQWAAILPVISCFDATYPC